MKYQSTRGGVRDVDFEEVVFSGYCPDGGLYVPQTIPIIDEQTLKSWEQLNASQITATILSLFVNEKIRKELPNICDNTFSYFYNNKNPLPLQSVGPIHVLELYHGPTLAFKDIGLNILSQIMDRILVERGSKAKANVLVETSGDTGPAAVYACLHNSKRINIFCLFPYKSVTKQQAMQLTTAMPKSRNLETSINIYSADRALECEVTKNICNDNEFVKEYGICSMNSINWIRIAAQICYYFYAYLQIKQRYKNKNINIKYVDFAVPSGAFGNCCGAAFAKAMGLPIRNIIPCTNENDIIHRTFKNGDFSSQFRNYKISKAPAMDIQVPYNLERFYWLCFEQNCNLVKSIMRQFENYGEDTQQSNYKYQFDETSRLQFQKFIQKSYCVDNDNIGSIISYLLRTYKYIVCPHGACAVYGALKQVQNNDMDNIPMIALLTAHPAKFPKIIRRFVGNGLSDSLKIELEKSLKHNFLPNENDEQECIELKSEGIHNWVQQWSDKIKKDIQVANHKPIQSKL